MIPKRKDYVLSDDLAVKTSQMTPAELRRLKQVLTEKLPEFIDQAVREVITPATSGTSSGGGKHDNES